MKKPVVIATRRSRLALWQAQHVKSRLEAAHAGLAVELLPMTTSGDELVTIVKHLGARARYAAADVVDYLLSGVRRG